MKNEIAFIESGFRASLHCKRNKIQILRITVPKSKSKIPNPETQKEKNPSMIL